LWHGFASGGHRFDPGTLQNYLQNTHFFVVSVDEITVQLRVRNPGFGRCHGRGLDRELARENNQKATDLQRIHGA